MTPALESLLLRYNKLSDYGHYAVRVLADMPRYRQRKQGVTEFLAPNPGTATIDPRLGYLVTHARQIDGLAELMPVLKEFASHKLAELDVPRLFKQRADAGHPIKPFYFNILTRRDLSAIPQLVDFSVSDGVLKILAPYYGLLPELSHIAVFVSGFAEPFTPGAKPKGTQCLHSDNHDLRHVKLFCFLSDVGEKDGPLTLLPADQSAWLLRKTGRWLRTSPFRDDREFLKYFREEDLVRITGPAGTVALVDTTNCLHYGSRCQSSGQRIALVIHYALFSAYSTHYSDDYEDLNMATSHEFRARIADNGRQALVYRLAPGANGSV